MARASGTPWGLLERLRYQSHSGRVIRRHRALHRLEFRRASLLHPLLLLSGSYVALWLGADFITAFWRWEFAFWLPRLDLPAALDTHTRVVLGIWQYRVSFPALSGSVPDIDTLRGSVAVCALIMLVAFLTMRGRMLPIGYLLWGACLVQLMSSGLFWLAPSTFGYSLASHVANGLEYALVLVLFVPLLLSFSYYVFEYSLRKKIAGTLLIVGGLVLVAPYQYLVHVMLIESGSLLLLPLLYVLFGLLFDIGVFIALYAWVVSWES
ncbi:MAG: hypothetical protein IT492_15385 [Gammaproteobacteria bacterium]|nr:hypothetical protein [Gammaproteobacteria bacterium]